MAKTTGKKPKTVLGTLGTLVLALLIYFLQGGKDAPKPPEAAAPEAVAPSSAAVPEQAASEAVAKPPAPPAAAKPAASQPSVAQPAPPKAQVQPAARHHARWHQSNLQRHWEKHCAEFPEYHSAAEYGEEVVEFVESPPEGTLRKTTAEGDQMFYHPPSNRFAVMTADGTLKTCFKPDQGIRYWNRQ